LRFEQTFRAFVEICFYGIIGEYDFGTTTFQPKSLQGRPKRKLAVIACMDARLDLFKMLGLEKGDAHIIRNAGGIVNDDMIRSLIISQHLLGTETEVILFTFAVFVISLFLFQKSGIGVSVLRAFEITSLTILPLGLEIFFFDRHAFDIHASDIQVQAGMAWFTNADVLLLSSTILGVTVFVELMRHKKGKR
jgi:hypothetical protein